MSTAGAGRGEWGAGDREIIYRATDGAMMAVDVKLGAGVVETSVPGFCSTIRRWRSTGSNATPGDSSSARLPRTFRRRQSRSSRTGRRSWRDDGGLRQLDRLRLKLTASALLRLGRNLHARSIHRRLRCGPLRRSREARSRRSRATRDERPWKRLTRSERRRRRTASPCCPRESAASPSGRRRPCAVP